MRQMTIKEVQQVSLDILKDVHEFCVENNIHYSLSGGTLLGAIRHNGFIPWDDDVDIQLPRPDYDRLVNTYQSKQGYKLFSHERADSKAIRFPYARICEMKKTYVDPGVVPWCSEKTGIWIDILPCDGIPGEKREASKHIRKIKRLERLSRWVSIKECPISVILKGKGLTQKVKFIVQRAIETFVFTDKFEELIKERRRYDYTTHDYFFTTAHYGIKEWQPKKNMVGFVLHKFEDKEFYIMKGFEANLFSLYGRYMQLPPENQRVSHNFNTFFWR
ncbi:MAG: LicD family protein [Prevotella sp.]|nr:LicD family protein [Prevotella sp.]